MLSWSTSGIERENANQEFKEFRSSGVQEFRSSGVQDVADRTIASKGERQPVKCGYGSVAVAAGS